MSQRPNIALYEPDIPQNTAATPTAPTAYEAVNKKSRLSGFLSDI